MPIRRRKSTTIFALADSSERYKTTDTLYPKYDLSIINGPPNSGSFDLYFGEQTVNVAVTESPAGLQTKLDAVDIKVVCTGSNLPGGTINIDLKNPKIAHVWVTNKNLNNGAQPKLVGKGKPRGWAWDQMDIWSDKGTHREFMLTKEGMTLTVNQRGKWQLSYRAHNFARRHVWVYKLDAYSDADELLFTLVPPASDFRPGMHEIEERGISDRIRSDLDNIAYWIRRGSGEYRD